MSNNTDTTRIPGTLIGDIAEIEARQAESRELPRVRQCVLTYLDDRGIRVDDARAPEEYRGEMFTALGLDIQADDGSWSGRGNDPQTPVETGV